MNEAIRNLEPKEVWNHFADLNAVPRASKKEEKVIQFMKDFGAKLHLETLVDDVGNVIIKKPATKGMGDRKPIVMQSHLDMVHQKNKETHFNFDIQGIEMYIDGDWVKAKGTTLGADNGLGVATIMAILESKDIPHPALEALFTIDEETGMTGAMGLQGGLLKGEILLNLDTEEDDEIGVGCAGGVDVTATGSYKEVSPAINCEGYKIVLKGLQGGHSGMDIHKGLGNANKLMNRVLYATASFIEIGQIQGGSLRNAIPRESEVIVAVSSEDRNDFKDAFEKIKEIILKEYHPIEPTLSITLETIDPPTRVMSINDAQKFLHAIYGIHNGVFRMSPAIEGLVETSNNVAKITVGKGNIKVECLTRSSVESSKEDIAQGLKAVFNLAGYEVTFSGAYPGWAPNSNSAILKVMEGIYQKMNGEKAHVAACHAGLECGILGQHYPEMDMISFGPTIKGAHSPDERASISSTQQFWKFVQEILKHIPKKI
ncbi:MAG: aminoacyl-histidine dipeptidase [Flavobacteriaceae bacterium]